MSLDGKNDFAGAAAAYRQAADGGNPVARYLLAEMYESGDGVPHDQAEAARQFQIAALAGYAPAQTHLGDHYEKGNGVARDQDLANRWYRFAADAGEDTATGRLAMAMIDGDGMPRDVETGLRLLRNCAEPGGGAGDYHPSGEAGGPGCQGALGALYLEGHGVKVDLKQGASWLSRSAEQHMPIAEKYLAKLYDEGRLKPMPINTPAAGRSCERDVDIFRSDFRAPTP